MTTRNDFRVEQTYDEIERIVLDAAMSVLLGSDPTDEPPSTIEAAYLTWKAKRIAERAVSHLDAAEDV